MSAFGISPQDRVAAFIDGPNLYGAARSADFDIDFKNLSALMKRDGRLIRAYYYTALADTDEFSPVKPLVDWLGYNGYSVVTKPLKEHTDAEGRKRVKGNMNVEMAVNALEIADSVDHMIFFSGDGELAPLIEAVQRKGVRVTVVSSKEGSQPMISDELRRQCDNFIDIKTLANDIRRTNERPGDRSGVNRTVEVERRPLRAARPS